VIIEDGLNMYRDKSSINKAYRVYAGDRYLGTVAQAGYSEEPWVAGSQSFKTRIAAARALKSGG